MHTQCRQGVLYVKGLVWSVCFKNGKLISDVCYLTNEFLIVYMTTFIELLLQIMIIFNIG